MMIKTQSLSTQNFALNAPYESDEKKQGFELIWYYWYLKNFANKPNKNILINKQPTKPLSPTGQAQKQQPQIQQIQQAIKPLTLQSIQILLQPFKQTYHMQTIETHLQHNLNAIKQRALLSRNDRFFVIQPQQEIHQIQHQLRNSSINLKYDQPIQNCLDDMLIQLYSYYLNSKNVYLIYKGAGQGTLLSHHYQNNSISSSIDSTQNRLKMILTHNSSESRLNTSKDSKGSLKNHQRNQRRSYGSLKSSLIMPGNTTAKLLQQDSILLLGNNGVESFVGEGDKMQNKIQEMQVIDKLTEFDGLQLWNIKYKKIPHTFVKFKKQSWTKGLNLPLMHPSAPKTINEFPIIPRISKLNPSIDKLLPFVSFIKLLQHFCPNLLPSIDSIFEYNGLPYIFLQQDNGYGSWKWQTNIGVLCYFVVYGNEQQTLSIKRVQRWVQQNSDSLLARTIKQMNKRQKQKNKKRKQLLKNLSIGGSGSVNSVVNQVIEVVNSNNSNNILNNYISNGNNNIIGNNSNVLIGNNSNNVIINNINNNMIINSNINVIQSSSVNSSLQMLITRDQNSDLAIW